ncbi:CcdB family protein [Salmonella enterica]|nr:CcdB family protein [Salmonella enterica]
MSGGSRDPAVQSSSPADSTLYTRTSVPSSCRASRSPCSTRPERLVPLVRLADEKEYAVMTHEMASIPARSLGAVFCDASLHRTQVKAAIDFLLDGI